MISECNGRLIVYSEEHGIVSVPMSEYYTFANSLRIKELSEYILSYYPNCENVMEVADELIGLLEPDSDTLMACIDMAYDNVGFDKENQNV